MFGNIVKNIQGIDTIYQSVALVFFFVFFLAVLFLVTTLKKDYVKKMEELPLEN